MLAVVGEYVEVTSTGAGKSQLQFERGAAGQLGRPAAAQSVTQQKDIEGFDHASIVALAVHHMKPIGQMHGNAVVVGKSTVLGAPPYQVTVSYVHRSTFGEGTDEQHTYDHCDNGHEEVHAFVGEVGLKGGRLIFHGVGGF
jgi:hypothetical protein